MTGSPPRLSRRARWAIAAGFYLLLLVAFLAAAEWIVRQRGVRPWRVTEMDVRVEPGGRFFAPHPKLGYTHLPGRFDVTLRGRHTFRVTHAADTLRVTRPPDAARSGPARPEIWIFGGSYTHGWALDDADTYPWQLQQALPEYDVVNFGVSGYGTIHAWVQLEEALARPHRARVAVVAYGGFHDWRNTFIRFQRKNVHAWNKLGPIVYPFARIDAEGRLVRSLAEVSYRPFPLQRHSAFVHFLEQRYNRRDERRAQSRLVTKQILLAVERLARDAGGQLVVASIQAGPNTAETLRWAEREGLPSVDISVDLDAEGNRHPFDWHHPSPQANRHYAAALAAFLGELLGTPPRLDAQSAAGAAASRSMRAISSGDTGGLNR